MSELHGASITYLGHSTVLVETRAGQRILIDPWTYSNPVCPEELKDPGHLDLLLITHGHSDHMGDALKIIQETGCTVACGYEVMLHLIGKGIAGHHFQPMNIGGSIRLPDLGLTLTQTLALHSAGIDEGGKLQEGGVAAGFVVTLDEGLTFYHAGDTALFSDMRLISELYCPTLAMLPIGDRFTMGPREAAYALELLSSVSAVLPLHWGTFPLLTGTPEALEAELKKRARLVTVHGVPPGGKIS